MAGSVRRNDRYNAPWEHAYDDFIVPGCTRLPVAPKCYDGDDGRCNRRLGRSRHQYKYTYSGINEEWAKYRQVGRIGTERSKTFPKAVQRHVGQALDAAQCGEEYPTVKALKGFGGRAFCGYHLCTSCISEKIEEGHRNAEKGNRIDPATAHCRRAGLQGEAELK